MTDLPILSGIKKNLYEILTPDKFPIFPDRGTKEQRKNYLDLLKISSQRFKLNGLPSKWSSLFENYVLPEGVSVETPIFVFTEYPQRHGQLDQDFSNWRILTEVGQAGPANILFNDDFTVVFGRVSSTRPHYGYRIMLLRHAELRVFAMNYTVENKSYRYSHERILSDLEELIILAFHSRENRFCLEKYRSKNYKIGYYLSMEYITHEGRLYTPITCYKCKNDHYIYHSPGSWEAWLERCYSFFPLDSTLLKDPSMGDEEG